jgi:hypothetical protein
MKILFRKMYASAQVELLNTSGKVLFQCQVVSPGLLQLPIQEKGQYLLRVRHGNSLQMKRILLRQSMFE